jgi:hypothetical protein
MEPDSGSGFMPLSRRRGDLIEDMALKADMACAWLLLAAFLLLGGVHGAR